jgi:hypothetical protein
MHPHLLVTGSVHKREGAVGLLFMKLRRGQERSYRFAAIKLQKCGAASEAFMQM